MKWKHDFDHRADPGVLVSLDPGKHRVGYAIFIDCELKACGWAEHAGEVLAHWGSVATCFDRNRPERVVMEIPKIYDRRRWKGNPNDLLPVAAHGALIAGALRPTIFEVVIPEDWKKQTPKEIQNERDQRVLSTKETAVLNAAPVPPGMLHNVIDAIGVGLWAIKRQLR